MAWARLTCEASRRTQGGGVPRYVGFHHFERLSRDLSKKSLDAAACDPARRELMHEMIWHRLLRQEVQGLTSIRGFTRSVEAVGQRGLDIFACQVADLFEQEPDL